MSLVNPLTGLPVADEDIAHLATLCHQQKELEGEIALATAKLKAMNERLQELSTKLIPDQLDQLGVRSITLTDGTKVAVQPFYSCKILSSEAFKWLDEHNHGGIIKTTAERQFSRAEREAAVEFVTANPEFRLNESIHHQTLSAFVKEIYSKNESLPEHLFSVYKGNRTKLS